MRARRPWFLAPLLLAGCFPVGVLFGPSPDSGEETGEPCPTWFQDADGDGYGDPEVTVVACQQPHGTVADDSDCDDSDPEVHPGASEICHDGADNDCDGTANHCTLTGIESLSTAQGKLLGAAEGDQAGTVMAMVGDSDGDGVGDLLVGVSAQDGTGTDAGAVYLLGGPILGVQTLGESGAIVRGEARGDRLGAAVAAAGDIDGDGLADLLLGAPGHAGMGSSAGTAYLFHGSLTGVVEVADAAAALLGEADGHEAGAAVDGAGDLDGDGFADLVVAAPAYGEGVTYVLHGPVSGTRNLSTADATIRGAVTGEGAGRVVSGGGDLDGDGYSDLAIAAPDRSPVAWKEGVVYLHYGPLAGEVTADAAAATLTGTDYNGFLGLSLDIAGDVDGDGNADLLAGSPYLDEGAGDAGGSYLFVGPLRGSLAPSDAFATFQGEEVDDASGGSLTAAGDLDADGLMDLLIGAAGNDYGASEAGAAYLFYAGLGGTTSLAEADAKWHGLAANDGAGGAVSGGGDLDGDGTPDLVVGAPEDDEGADGAGAIYLVYGNSAM